MKFLGEDAPEAEQTGNSTPPGVFRASGDAPELPCRCLFANHCLRLRLLGLPRNGNISQCFANCTGMLLVSHGSLELRQGQTRTMVAEGGCIELPLQEHAEL